MKAVFKWGFSCAVLIGFSTFSALPVFAEASAVEPTVHALQVSEEKRWYLGGGALTQNYRMTFSNAFDYSKAMIPEDYRALPDTARGHDTDLINYGFFVGYRWTDRLAFELGYYDEISVETNILPSLTIREGRQAGFQRLDLSYLEAVAVWSHGLSDHLRLFARGGMQLVRSDVYYRTDSRQKYYQNPDPTRVFRRANELNFDAVAGLGLEVGHLNSHLGLRLGYNLSTTGLEMTYLQLLMRF